VVQYRMRATGGAVTLPYLDKKVLCAFVKANDSGDLDIAALQRRHAPGNPLWSNTHRLQSLIVSIPLMMSIVLKPTHSEPMYPRLSAQRIDLHCCGLKLQQRMIDRPRKNRTANRRTRIWRCMMMRLHDVALDFSDETRPLRVRVPRRHS